MFDGHNMCCLLLVELFQTNKKEAIDIIYKSILTVKLLRIRMRACWLR